MENKKNTKESKNILEEALADLELIKEEAIKVAKEQLANENAEKLEKYAKEKIAENFKVKKETKEPKKAEVADATKKDSEKEEINESKTMDEQKENKKEKVEESKSKDEKKEDLKEDVQITITTSEDKSEPDTEEVVSDTVEENEESSEEKEEEGDIDDIDIADIEKELAEMESIEDEKMEEDVNIEDLDLDDLDIENDDVSEMNDTEIMDEVEFDKEEEPEIEEAHGIAHSVSRLQGSDVQPRDGNDYRKNQLRDAYSEGVENKYKKLLEANKKLNKKLTSLIKENEDLTSANSDYVDALEKAKDKLREMAVFTVNAANVNKLLVNETTTRDERKMIIEKFEKITSVDESKKLYQEIVSDLNGTKKTIKENVEDKVNTSLSSSKSKIVESTAFKSQETQHLDKIKRLMNIKN